MRVWWSKSPAPGNLGDVLTPFILRNLGIPARWAPMDRAQVLAIGSIVRFSRAGQVVWGSGAMRETDRPCPEARYLALRGPLTGDVVRRAGGVDPGVYGDPALLLPEIHTRPVEVLHDLGVVPHYIDDVPEGPGVTISPLSADPIAVVDRIRSCRAIVSSSLHGIIVAHAYRIPAAWVRLSDRLDGDDTKFHDYAASVGIDLVPYRSVDDACPVLPPPFDTRPLKDALA